jgi:hypothetical protein
MAFGKTAEEKAAQQEERARQQAASAEQARLQQEEKQAAKQRAAFNASPVGQAVAAKQQGQGFFEIQLVVGSSQQDSTILGGNNFNIGKTRTMAHAGTLASIESAGWRLEHVGHVFVVTGESSRDKFMATGQQTAVSGHTVGIYLFRNTGEDPSFSG